jgi:hypothetical protein
VVLPNSGSLIIGTGGATFNFPAGQLLWNGGDITCGATRLPMPDDDPG